MKDPLSQEVVAAEQLWTRGEAEAALARIAPVTAARPGWADAHCVEALCLHHLGQFSRAEASFRASLAANPHLVEASLGLTILLSDMGRYQAAQEAFREATAGCQPAKALAPPKACGHIANLHAELGAAYRDAGDLTRAAEELTRALVLEPTFSDLRAQLGQIRFEQGELTQAHEALRRAAAERPNAVEIRAQLGCCCYALGLYEAAEKAFAAIPPESTHFRRAQAYLRILSVQKAGPDSPRLSDLMPS